MKTHSSVASSKQPESPRVSQIRSTPYLPAQIMTWLFGGWAEELWHMSPPRPHRDIDLLHPAKNFQQLDRWLFTTSGDLFPVEAKRFSHKRALLYQQIMIEIVLLEPQPEAYVTNFFNGQYQVFWPSDTLTSLPLQSDQIAIASHQALQLYRDHHLWISLAYHIYQQQQQNCSNRCHDMAHAWPINL